ncbi:MAG: hypothetical protein NUV84_03855 [Candidatus Uhrbacteria bacterium]|nr:hypothetical protein [Candidatus Uhrbacteria bacterium]
MKTTPPSMLNMRKHDGMIKFKNLLVAGDGWLVFDDALEPWTHKPARDGRPEMFRSKVNGVEIWLRGLSPEQVENGLFGHIEVKLNEVVRQDDGSRSQYLYVNVLPLPEGAAPDVVVTIVRPPKAGGRRVLPPGFNPETDFVVDRQGEPWQVIMVRDSGAPAPTAA